jgi:hypothetical protein
LANKQARKQAETEIVQVADEIPPEEGIDQAPDVKKVAQKTKKLLKLSPKKVAIPNAVADAQTESDLSIQDQIQ